MAVLKEREKTYSHKQDGELPWVTGKVRHSPYGLWGPGYRFSTCSIRCSLLTGR